MQVNLKSIYPKSINLINSDTSFFNHYSIIMSELDFNSLDLDGSTKKPATVGKSYFKRFNLKHVFRGGAVVWLKHENIDYYVVFKSISRPNRGIQLPGGRIERLENPAEAVLREVKEETGIETKIVCPLGFIHFENQEDNYSNLQIYYIVRPTHPLNVKGKWKYIDKDRTRQELECWFVPTSKDSNFLSAGQDKVILMFKDWLEEHKPAKQNNYSYKPENNKNNQEERDIFKLI